RAGERLADDPGKEARSGAVRLAGTHADGRQPERDALKKAAPAVVGEQQLVDRLLRAVARERRAQELVADRLREGRAEYCDGRGEHHARLVTGAHFADRIEQRSSAIEVDAVALVEIGLRLAGYDGGEMKDEIGPLCDK